MKRSTARELAFKAIYSRFFNAEVEEEIKDIDKEGLEFVNNILTHYTEYKHNINDIIATHLKGYTIDRLYKIDLAILVLAIIELHYIKENPTEVVINEAVELAKKYSTEKSPRFIHGVLADILK
ncbi:MAG: transcription antitermination factor NusB [Clostridiales bacterium]|nr:transcription antitermination factor NusB [Clostridiales bacterium]